MKIEHMAFQVRDPEAVADWYIRHLGLKVVLRNPAANRMHFLSDQAGAVVEIYHNPAEAVPDYRNQSPITLHLAFASDDPKEDCERLMEAGANFIAEERPNENTHVIMMRDPWGLAIQLANRRPSFFG